MISKFQLKNGLKVLFVQSHKSPVVSVQMWVRTGSADESKGEEGISHFIEHLVFKGTRDFKVGEIASVVEGSGGELNAYTSFDQTVFYVTISKHFEDIALKAVSQMMGFPLFDPAEIENEREVVVEEIKRGMDSLGRKASQNLFSTVYKKHPYGIPVIGFEKNVRSWSAKKIKTFYESRYSPQNMFLVVAGDFEKSSMKQKVQKIFSELRKTKVAKRMRKKEIPQKGMRVFVEESKFEQSIAYLAWRIPSYNHKDSSALQVLGSILGHGDSSRLVKRLRIDDALVNSVGASAYAMKDEGLFLISLGYNHENTNKFLVPMAEEVVRVTQQAPSAREVNKAIISALSEEQYSVETVDGLSSKIGHSEFATGNPKEFEKSLAKLKKVKPDDVLRVAQKYLNSKGLNIAVVTKDSRHQADEVWKKFAKKLGSEIAEKSSRKKAAPIKLEKLKLPPLPRLGNVTKDLEPITLPGGGKVYFRKSNESHVVAARTAFLGGARIEDARELGISELLSRAWLGGTKSLTEMELAIKIEEIAAGFSPNAGRNSMGLAIEALKQYEGKAANLFFDVLENPTFPNEIVQREKLVQLEHIKSQKDQPAQLCSQQFMRTIFRGHPYANELIGTEKTLENLEGKNLLHLYHKICVSENANFVVSGNLDAALWKEKIQESIEKLGKKAFQLPSLKVPSFDREEVGFTHVEKEQTHVIYGFRGLTFKDEDRYTLQLIQAILAGQGGRLFLELRDKNSLAYSVSPIRMEGIDTGYFGAYIGCSPDKSGKAISMMHENFELLCEKKVEDWELERAQRYLIGSHDIDLQKSGAVASTILYDVLYGLPAKESLNVADKYLRVSATDIQKLATKLFRQPRCISIVGAKNPL